MKKLVRYRLLASCACLAACLAPPAFAQQATGATPLRPTANGGIEEVVVTANKREERLSRVGATITALSSTTLKEHKITSLQDIAGVVPGLAYAPSANNTPIFTLRGIGFNNSALGVYPAVSVYVDQFPLPFPVLASHSDFDLSRIEVLKGPQGTLFGENATGGAINFIAAKPTDKREAGFSISYGRFNQVDGTAYVSGQITDTLRARAALTGLNADGWQNSDTRPGDHNGKQSYVAGRLTADWDPISTVHVSTDINSWSDTSQPQAEQFILLYPQTPSLVHPNELAYPFSPQNPQAADWSTGAARPRSDRKFLQAAVRIDVDLPYDLKLTSLTSYDHLTQTQSTDNDGSALNVSDLAKDDGAIKSINQELRLANSTASVFRWVAGGNYEHSETYEDQTLIYGDDSSNSAPDNFIHQSEVTVAQKITNYAFFGNGEYDVLPKLTVKGGVRYTHSSNTGTICGFDSGDGNINGLFNLLGGLLGSAPFTPLTNSVNQDQRCYSLNANLVPEKTPYVDTLSEDNVSFRAGLDYKLDPNTLLYVNVSRGYKGGSFPVLAAATESQYHPVTQESLMSYEGGVKTSFWDHKAQLTGAAFYYDYSNKQVLGKEHDPVFGFLDVLINVPKSRVIGGEGEFNVRPIEGLTLDSAITYLNSRIQRYAGTDALGVTENFAGSALPFTPQFAYRQDIEYRRILSDGGAPFFGVTVHGQTESDTAIGGSGITIPEAPTTNILPGLVHPFTTNAYALVDLRLGYEAPGGRWGVMLYGKNVFNKYYWTNVVTSSDFTARYAGFPATYGVTLNFKL